MPKNRTPKELKLIQKVWNKGKKIRGKNPDLYRKDSYGNLIYFHSYGKNSLMGWHKDHGKPKCLGGSDHLNNLHPVQARENLKKGCKYPYKRKRKRSQRKESSGGSSWGWVAAAVIGLIVVGSSSQ